MSTKNELQAIEQTSPTEEEIFGIIEKHADTLTEEQLKVLPLVGYGMTTAKAARVTGIEATSIRQWMRTNKEFRAAMRDVKAMAMDYHRALLNQAAVVAWDRLFEVLESDYAEDDTTGRRVQADMVRFTLSELGLKGNRPEEKKEETPEMHVSNNSIQFIVNKIAELQNSDNVVEGNYKQVDEKPEHTYNSMTAADQIGETPGEEIRKFEETNFAPKHPETKYGKVNLNDKNNRIQCHICGKWNIDLVIHIRTEHNVSPGVYRKMFGIPNEITLAIHAPQPAAEEDIKLHNAHSEESEEVLNQGDDSLYTYEHTEIVNSAKDEEVEGDNE